MKKSVVLLLVALLLPAIASAQTMSIHVDDGGLLTRWYDVIPGTPFEVVTIMDTAGHDIKAVEWVQTALTTVVPGVFKVADTNASACVILDLMPEGEYPLPLCACLPPAPDLELARVTYFDVSSAIGSDVVMTIRGFQPGDSAPSSFDGDPGLVDCSDALFTAMMHGGDPYTTGSDVHVPSGALVLNPTPHEGIGAGENSFTQIKGRYR